MKASELIEELKKFDGDLDVFVVGFFGNEDLITVAQDGGDLLLMSEE